MDSSLLTTGQAARLCSVTPDAVLKWIKRGRVPAVQTRGGHYRVDCRELADLVGIRCCTEGAPAPGHERTSALLRCWEFMSRGGEIPAACRECVVYRIRAARCFEVLGLGPGSQHARLYCRTTCEECGYFQLMTGRSVNVLVISEDGELIASLAPETSPRLALRFARNGYEASAAINDFRPAFIVLDQEIWAVREPTLPASLMSDPRLPGLRIILGAAPSGRRRPKPSAEGVIAVLDKPFDRARLEAVITSIPVEAEPAASHTA